MKPKAPRKLQVSLLAIATVCLLESAGAACPSKGKVNGPGSGKQGQIDFTVYFRFPPTQEQIDLLKERIQEASAILCDATDGQMRFGTVKLTGGFGAEVDKECSDVWVYPFSKTGRSYSDLGISPEGNHITLLFDDFQGGKLAIAHEFGHLALELSDEYIEGRFGPCKQEDEPGAEILSGVCLMQAGTFADFMVIAVDETAGNNNELCTEVYHDLVRGDDPAFPDDCTPMASFGGCDRPGAEPDPNDPCDVQCCLFNFDSCRYEGSAQSWRSFTDTGQVLSCWDHIADTFSWLELPSGGDGLPEALPSPDCDTLVIWDEEDISGTNQVALVLDRSYSMAFSTVEGQLCGDDCPAICQNDGADPAGCHQAAIDFLEGSAISFLQFHEFNPDAEAGIVRFASSAQILEPLQPVAANFDDLTGAVAGLTPGGNTNIGAGLEKGLEALEAAGGGTRAMLLITDGHHNVKEEDGGVDPLVAAQDAADAGVRVFTITTGEASDDEVIGEFTEATGGRVIDAPNRRELVAAVAQQAARYTNAGLLVPKLRYELDRLGSFPPPPAADGGDLYMAGDPEDGVPPTHAQVFKFLVEESTERIVVTLGGTMVHMEGFGVRAELTGPPGPNPAYFDSVAPGASPLFQVRRHGYFILLSLISPNPGSWSLRLGVPPDAALADLQTGTLTIASLSPEADFLTSLDRRVVHDPVDPVLISAAPIFRTHLRDLEILDATVVRPDGSLDTIGFTPPPMRGVPHRAAITELPFQGRYEVRIRFRSGPGTTNDPGEEIFIDQPPNTIDVPVLERIAVESFLVTSGPKFCPGNLNDCDGDGLTTSMEFLCGEDIDGDGVPNDCDLDADGDEIPDWVDGLGDQDSDSAPGFCDPDADNDGVPDGEDPSRDPREPGHVLQLPLIGVPPPECGRARRAAVAVSSEEPIIAASFVLGIEDGAGIGIRDIRVAGDVPAGTVRSFSSHVALDPSGVRTVAFALELSRPLPPAIAMDLVEMEVVAAERDSTGLPRRFFSIPGRSSGLSVERRLGMVVVDPHIVEGSVTVLPDTRPPALHCPPPITVPCSGPEGALVEYEVSAADACDPDPAVSCDIGSGRVFPTGTTTVTCTARDSSGNTASCRFDVTVTCAIDGGLQLPGDCNQDGSCDLSDAVCLLGFLFLGSPRRLPCDDGGAESPSNLRLLDFNGDGRLDITDGIAKLSFLFVGGPPHVLGRTCATIPACEDACSR